MHLNRVQDLGTHPCLSRITLSIPLLKVSSLPRVPINVTTQSDLGLWLDLSFQGWMLQDHRTSLNPCSRGHGCTVRVRAEQRGRAWGRRTNRKQCTPEALSQKTVQGSPAKLRPGLHTGRQRPSACPVPGRSGLTPHCSCHLQKHPAD